MLGKAQNQSPAEFLLLHLQWQRKHETKCYLIDTTPKYGEAVSAQVSP